jgi:acetolactate synthase-1/2/3 large subunit
MTGAEALLRTLAASGIEVCFMNPGTSEMQFVAALDRVPAMRGVLCLFEGVCSGAADGYARMTGRPASTLLHLGPGLANGLANFHNARKAKSPVVSIVGEHSTQHLQYDAPLSADIESFAAAVSTHFYTASSAHEIGMAAAATVKAARRPPGQIAHLIIPADFSWSEAGDAAPAPVFEIRDPPDSANVDRAAALLKCGAETALLLSGTALTGDGLRYAGQLATSFGVRVFANRNAGRMESGRGRFQPQRIAYFPEPAEAMLAGVRHLILVEAQAPVSFFGYPGRRSYLAPEDAEVHVLASDRQDGVAALGELVRIAGAVRLELPAEEVSRVPSADEPLTPDAIGCVIGALLPENAIVSDEMISSSEAVWTHLVRAAPHDHLPISGGSIGQGLPAAVGAAIACPDRKVIALEADGSAMYTLQALWTMARESLDIVTVIFANRRYRILDVEMQRTGVSGFGPAANDMIDISRPEIDFVRLAESMGVTGSRATNAGELGAQFGAAMRGRGPFLIEAVMP